MKFLKSILMSFCVLSLASCDLVVNLGSGGNNNSNSSSEGESSMVETIDLSLFENISVILVKKMQH